jgi:hypothetical protein
LIVAFSFGFGVIFLGLQAAAGAGSSSESVDCSVPPGVWWWDIARSADPVRPGDTREFSMLWRRPEAARRIPPQCADEMLAVPADVISLNDERTAFRISEDARPGQTVAILALVEGRQIYETIEITGTQAIVLDGRYREQDNPGCPGRWTIGELHFEPGNRFSVTWQPFEAYKDYWGTYRFDSQSGAIELEATGGSHIPDGLDLSGQLRLEGEDRLVFDAMDFGIARNQSESGTAFSDPACSTYVFERQ